jgi:pSer/pThr/pTyr-binding forkhead associated (FHA) protein
MKPASITLTFTQGGLEGKEFHFEKHARCVVGRAPDCDIQLPQDLRHADVSRHHCLLDIDPPTIRVRDLGSRNGTYVNGLKIGQRPRDRPVATADLISGAAQDLKDGDELRVGHTILEVAIDGAPDTPQMVAAAGDVPLFFE